GANLSEAKRGRTAGKTPGSDRLSVGSRVRKKRGPLREGGNEPYPVARLKAGIQIVAGIGGKQADNPRFSVFQDLHLHRHAADGHIPDAALRGRQRIRVDPFGRINRVMNHWTVPPAFLASISRFNSAMASANPPTRSINPYSTASRPITLVPISRASSPVRNISCRNSSSVMLEWLTTKRITRSCIFSRYSKVWGTPITKPVSRIG